MAKKPARGSAPSFVKAKEPDVNELAAIRQTVKQLRDLGFEITTSEAMLKEKREIHHNIERKTLPELLSKAGINKIGIEAEGNYPGYIAERSAYYRANIAASWPEEKREKAFNWLRENGGGDLIKYEIVITISQRNEKLLKLVIATIKKIKGLEWHLDQAVPWGSLTKFIKEAYERRKLKVPLDLLGADVGEIVKLKSAKD